MWQDLAGCSSVDIHGDEALQFFAETRHFGSGSYPDVSAAGEAEAISAAAQGLSYDTRQQAYPVSASLGDTLSPGNSDPLAVAISDPLSGSNSASPIPTKLDTAAGDAMCSE